MILKYCQDFLSNLFPARDESKVKTTTGSKHKPVGRDIGGNMYECYLPSLCIGDFVFDYYLFEKVTGKILFYAPIYKLKTKTNS